LCDVAVVGLEQDGPGALPAEGGETQGKKAAADSGYAFSVYDIEAIAQEEAGCDCR